MRSSTLLTRKRHRPPARHAEATKMAKIEVKQVRATMRNDDLEPHWEAVVDYGAFEVNIPLPARCLNR
jgi:hypothetical protein